MEGMEELLRLFANPQFGGAHAAKAPPPERPVDRPEDHKPCKCGYNPHSQEHNPKSERCNVKLALQNHLTFPSFEMMTEYDEPSEFYYEVGNLGYEPSRHWATLIEITHDLSYLRPGCSGINQFGERISVHFYHENDETPVQFKWTQIKPGNTLAILYATKKQFLDGSEGIRQEDLDSCYIFNTSLKNVQDEAQKLLNHADIESNENIKELVECFGCGVKSDVLSRCANCKLAKYCSKECQTKAWKAGHKNLCKQSEVLLRLTVLPRYSFRDHLTFNKQNPHATYLLPYKPIYANRRKQNNH